jgi:hypothetical protein
MNINTDAIDEVSLALLYLTLHDRYRALKGFDWDVLNRLHERGFIEDPVNKTKSVILTEEALRESERLFNQHFAPKEEKIPRKIFEILIFALATPRNHGHPEVQYKRR